MNESAAVAGTGLVLATPVTRVAHQSRGVLIGV